MFGKNQKSKVQKMKSFSKKKKKKKKYWTGMRTYDRSSEENHWQGAKLCLRPINNFPRERHFTFSMLQEIAEKAYMTECFDALIIK